jgi:signal transduction histidine kinase
MDSYPVSLAQVVTNLAIHSLQHAFVPGGSGRIVIRAALREDDEVRIEYSDDGQGIEPALQGRVFEPFFTTRRMIGGSGLGLYIVNQIVTRQLDGSIVLEGSAERGARFVMHFPRVARHTPNVGHLLSALPRTPIDES